VPHKLLIAGLLIVDLIRLPRPFLVMKCKHPICIHQAHSSLEPFKIWKMTYRLSRWSRFGRWSKFTTLNMLSKEETQGSLRPPDTMEG
jgi:hypothetical protein